MYRAIPPVHDGKGIGFYRDLKGNRRRWPLKRRSEAERSFAARTDERPESGFDREWVVALIAAGCRTILDQQEPSIRYRDNNTVARKVKEVGDPKLREVPAKAGAASDEVLLMVTCRTFAK